MTCKHIRQAKTKINDLVENLNNRDSSFWKKSDSFAWASDIRKLIDEFNELNRLDKSIEQWWALLFYNNITELSLFTLNLIKWEGNNSPVYESLVDIYDTLSDCNCYSNVSSIENDLSFYKNNYSDLQDRNSGLERELRNLRGEKEDEIKDLREKFEQEKTARQNDKAKYNNEKLTWTRTEGQKNVEIAEKKGKIKSLETELENEKKKAVKLDDKLEARNREIRELNKQLERLQINNEKLLAAKLHSEKETLELFATELKIDLEQVYSLRKYHERLFQARKSNNQINITTHEDNIEKTKRELLGKKVSIIIIQEVCRKCERIAELSFESEQAEQRQKQIKMNEWKNINSNFTPELVQEWIKNSFTVEQCRDWINISHSSQQNLAIKEPVYYSWLRDVKKVDTEWVLNNGNEKELGQEFFKWYQEQQQTQAQIEQPVK